jgi:hypothetical protein
MTTNWVKNNPILLSGIGSSIAVDYVSQRLRGEIIPQGKRYWKVFQYPSIAKMDILKKDSLENKIQSTVKAVNFGKFKTLLQTTTHIGLPLALIYQNSGYELDPQLVSNSVGYVLNVASVLGSAGILVKEKENIFNFYNYLKMKF